MFLFDPSETWAHLSEFEEFLGDYFAAYGFEANNVKAVTGATNEQIFIISKIPEPKLPPMPKPVEKKSLNQLRDPKTYG